MSEVNPYSTVTPDNSHLGAIIPTAKGRKIAYSIYAVIALIVGNTAVGFAAASLEQPVWLVIASAVIANLAAPFSALAIANAKNTDS
jgi:hypothetical protein